MKVVVSRSGGFAGLRRTWTVDLDELPDARAWIVLIDGLPWDALDVGAASVQPDRFVYEIRVDRRQAVLPETRLRGPWRELVDRVCSSPEARVEQPGPRPRRS